VIQLYIPQGRRQLRLPLSGTKNTAHGLRLMCCISKKKGVICVQLRQLPMNELAQQLRQSLADSGSARLLVTGYSMVPMLRNGRDSVTLGPVDRSARPGDVIFYQRSDGQLVLHRVIRAGESGYICCGDHQHEQETVLPEQLLGIVTEFCRAGKRFSVGQPVYRLYAFCVTHTFPIRKPFLSLRKTLGRLKRRLRRR